MICRQCFRIIKENEKSVKRGKRYFHESCLKTVEQQEEQNRIDRIKQIQVNQLKKENNIKDLEQRDKTYDEGTVTLGNYYTKEELEYLDAMHTIRDEIREYEEKYGENAIKQMKYDALIRMLIREVTVEEIIDDFKQQELVECSEWEEIFKEGEPVKWERTTNNPLESFQRISNREIGKNDS